MYTTKSQVLQDAPSALNKAGQPWEVSVEDDAIVARWRWKDATYFSPGSVSVETQNYTFTVTLGDNGKWKELDRTAGKSASVSGSGAKLSASGFVGKTTQKSFEFGVGRNNKTGETGLITTKFDTTAVKKPIREYLTACGWKKAGLLDFLRG